MTHSIQLDVRVKSWEDVQEIKERLLELDDYSWMTMFALKKVPKTEFYPDIQSASGMPPFIVIPLWAYSSRLLTRR